MRTAGAGFRNLRADFPLLAANPGLVYLDSAATSQKPGVVLDALRTYYETVNANPHRGAYKLSGAATEAYHGARAEIARFLGAADVDSLLFTRGTTEAVNLLATGWGVPHVHRGDRIVVTRLEHHANFVPWQQLARAVGAEFRICELTKDGRVDLDQLRLLVTANTKVVAFGHVSNALGTINDVREIVKIAHAIGAVAFCDGAQGAPHLRVAFDDLGVDAYAFSGHKMLGPMGIGGVIVRRRVLETMHPYQFGGDMIEFVFDGDTTWNVPPHKFEAGTPNVEGAVGLAAAVQYLDALGMDAVRAHEVALTRYAMEQLAAIEGLQLYGPHEADARSGVVSFNLDDIHPHDLSTMLDVDGVCVRAGHHCAQPLMRAIHQSATVRASFYVYNTEADVDALVESLQKAKTRFHAHA
ncbi:MAG TPA: SufS family cysteine desulfurase [Gemmatimonadaceae bacterium]|jgi:cysteine desulfurase/selenocysteine lyase